MNKEKLSGVLEWPVLTKVKQVQVFLGFVNFYHRFIENFAKISKPLSDLTKKDLLEPGQWWQLWGPSKSVTLWTTVSDIIERDNS